MSNRLIGVIGVLWGAVLLLDNLLRVGQAQAKGAYAAGQSAGWMFGLVLLLVGIYYIAKSPKKSPK